MRINIKTTNVTLTPELSGYLSKRLEALEKMTERFGEAAIVDVEIGRTSKHHHTGDIYRAEINVHVRNRSFRAMKETPDLFSSIDEAKDQMLEELRSDKEKHLSLLRRGSQQVKTFIKGMRWWDRGR
ncbi:MAG TPA: ribosome-associated translation inhibitor RaiA [Candidatus Paceibacterota bacterium]